MSNLKKYVLQHNKKTGEWDLVHETSGRKVKSFTRKADALVGGVLAGLVGTGSVKIRRLDGSFQEERTYPRSADPRGSKG